MLKNYIFWGIFALVIIGIVATILHDRRLRKKREAAERSRLAAASGVASAAADAAHTAKAQARFERAASRACGASGGFALVDSNTVQCITPHGRQTITAKVAL